MVSKHTNMGVDFCPCCGHLLEMAFSPEGETPNPYDLTFCLYCASLLQYSSDMKLIEYPEEEFNQLPASEQENLRRIQSVVMANKP